MTCIPHGILLGLVKLRKESWMGHAARKEEKRKSEDLDLDARIILKWILQKEKSTVWAGFI
jgi:hypothetical protein